MNSPRSLVPLSSTSVSGESFFCKLVPSHQSLSDCRCMWERKKEVCTFLSILTHSCHNRKRLIRLVMKSPCEIVLIAVFTSHHRASQPMASLSYFIRMHCMQIASDSWRLYSKQTNKQNTRNLFPIRVGFGEVEKSVLCIFMLKLFDKKHSQTHL